MIDPIISAAVVTSLAALSTALISYFLNRKRHSKELEKWTEEISALRAQAERSESTAKRAEGKAERALSQGQEYKDSSLVFHEMYRFIDEFFASAPAMGVKAPVVELKLLAVSMTYSWDGFITNWVPRLLKEHPHGNIELHALIVDHEFLSTKTLGKRYVDWVNRSKFHTKEAQSFVENQCPAFHPRLIFTLRAYKNIPHWHGWMINNEHLFLGRTDWDTSGELPILSVGTNKYRYFDSTDHAGDERLSLFRNWHSYYFDYDSVEICSFPVHNSTPQLKQG